MFETAEVGLKLTKSEFRVAEPELRRALLDVQYRLLENSKFPVIILVNGVDGAGKGETVNLFNEWMDPRHIHTHAFGGSTDVELARPEMWRFWTALPPKGHIGILFGSWYTDPILQRVLDNESGGQFRKRLAQIREFESMLVAEGALVVKLWFHLSKEAQKTRLRQLSEKKKTAWRVTKGDWKLFKHYDEFINACGLALGETSTAAAPWNVIEGSNHEYRSLTAGRLLLDALESRLKAPPVMAKPAPVRRPKALETNLLKTADYSRHLDRNSYQQQLDKLQGQLNLLTRHKKMRDRSIVMVFEGMDAAGKGSTIRRITRAMDARFYHVVPIAAPSDEERAQPYLWRFWRHVPPHGHAVIFDRSWYGRVLVERVEKFCPEEAWQRAYGEINGFEAQLADDGVIVAKFWLAISAAEQLKRFKERAKIPHKQFKITDEDWRNRKRWPAYEIAVADMLERTSTEIAPWHLIATNDKPWARVESLKRLVETIEKRL